MPIGFCGVDMRKAIGSKTPTYIADESFTLCYVEAEETFPYGK